MLDADVTDQDVDDLSLSPEEQELLRSRHVEMTAYDLYQIANAISATQGAVISCIGALVYSQPQHVEAQDAISKAMNRIDNGLNLLREITLRATGSAAGK